MTLTKAEVVARLDDIAQRSDMPNLRGSLVRVPASRFYRPPPRGGPCGEDVPNAATLTTWLAQAELEMRVRAVRS